MILFYACSFQYFCWDVNLDEILVSHCQQECFEKIRETTVALSTAKRWIINLIEMMKPLEKQTCREIQNYIKLQKEDFWGKTPEGWEA